MPLPESNARPGRGAICTTTPGVDQRRPRAIRKKSALFFSVSKAPCPCIAKHNKKGPQTICPRATLYSSLKEKALSAQALPAFRTAARQHFAAAQSGFAGPKSVPPFPDQAARLIGSFHSSISSIFGSFARHMRNLRQFEGRVIGGPWTQVNGPGAKYRRERRASRHKSGHSLPQAGDAGFTPDHTFSQACDKS